MWLPVSDLEKTIIDMVYYGDVIRDELWPAILKALSPTKLNGYLEKYPPGFSKKVIGLIRIARAEKLGAGLFRPANRADSTGVIRAVREQRQSPLHQLVEGDPYFWLRAGAFYADPSAPVLLSIKRRAVRHVLMPNS
jgi:hypothetical protein